MHGRTAMNAHSFDAITRHLRNGCGRRQAVTLLTSGALSAFLLGRGSVVQAGCKKVGKKCDKNKDCCDGARCKGDKKDKKGKCRCKGRFTKCDNKCYDLDKDEQHCGACDTACLAGESCVNGICAEGGCTIDRDSCAPDGSCISCPDRPGSVCYLDGDGRTRCSRFLLCGGCENDADCAGLGPGARCVECAGQCGGSGGACAAD
jgi:hypothetical protein